MKTAPPGRRGERRPTAPRTTAPWGAASWTNATGAAGTLSDSAYTQVATCAADAASCSSSALVFALAPKTTVQRSGNHTLVVRWKVESIGS